MSASGGNSGHHNYRLDPVTFRKRDEPEICGHAAKRWRLSRQAQFFSLTEMRLIIQKRKNLYNGIERSWSLTRNSNELASCHKTRTGFRH